MLSFRSTVHWCGSSVQSKSFLIMSVDEVWGLRYTLFLILWDPSVGLHGRRWKCMIGWSDTCQLLKTRDHISTSILTPPIMFNKEPGSPNVNICPEIPSLSLSNWQCVVSPFMHFPPLPCLPFSLYTHNTHDVFTGSVHGPHRHDERCIRFSSSPVIHGFCPMFIVIID